jgi:hypothetical protein
MNVIAGYPACRGPAVAGRLAACLPVRAFT